MRDIVYNNIGSVLRKDDFNLFVGASYWVLTNDPMKGNDDVPLNGKWKLTQIDSYGKRLTEPTVYAHLLRERLDTKFSYLVFDIETTGKIDNPQFEMIGLLYKDENGNVEKYILKGYPEDVLPDVRKLIEKLNPTVLVGHNIFKFDIPVLQHWLPFRKSTKRMRFGAETKDITVYTYDGYINCVDTYLFSRRCDAMGVISADSFSLKNLSKQIGYQRTTPEKFDGTFDYLIEDLESTALLFEHLIQWFVGLFPYANVSWASIYEGNGTIIENTIVSHIIINKPQIKEQNPTDDTYEGGYVELLKAGLHDDVYKVDVVSMYPNILKRYIKPRWDNGFFQPFVDALLQKRLEQKKKGNFPAQYGLKILVNSIYGFLGTRGMFLSDMEAAKEVTRIGREIVLKMKQIIEEHGGEPIEIDTDGIYFMGNAEEIVDAISEAIAPFEVELEQYDRGLFVKKKNYCLWKDGKKILHGNSLRGRRDGTVQRLVLNTILEHYPDIELMLLDIIDGVLLGEIDNKTKDWKSADTDESEPDVKNSLTTNEKLDLAVKVLAVCRRFDSLYEVQSFLSKYGSRQYLTKRINNLYQPQLFGR